MLDKELALKLVQAHSWHHDFEIIPGVRTLGTYNPSELWRDLELPDDLAGTSLADIGASNGYFSFEARKRGCRAVAFDFRHKDNSGFGLAQHINGLTDIEHHQINVLNIAPNAFGQFDVVLALGLLYHTADPYRALANCASLARDRLLIESYCIDHLLPRRRAAEPIMQFIADPTRFPDQGQPNADRTNFWGFTGRCLERMVEDIGFDVRRRDVRGDRVFIDARRIPGRAVNRLQIAYDIVPRVAVGSARDDPKAWKIF